MKKIGLFAHNLFTGGITSYLITMSDYLCGQDCKVVLYYENFDEECRKKFDSKIEFHKIEKVSVFKILKGIIFSKFLFEFFIAFFKHDKLKMTQIFSYIDVSLHKTIDEKFDVAISSEEFFCNEFIALNVNAKKKIGWIHPDYEMLNAIKKIDERIFEQLDKVIVVSNENKKYLEKEYPNFGNKFMYIANIIDDKRMIKLSMQNIDDVDKTFDGINFLTVCRLDNSSKRLDRIVATCVYLKKMELDFQWYIVGDGKDRAILEKWIKDYGIGDRLHLLGNKTNPYPYYKWADCFVLTSLYEGKPISVEEAKILHTPVIVTNYKAAAEQVDYESGYIIPNEDPIIPKCIYDIVNKNKNRIVKWNSNYSYNNEEIYQKLDFLMKV